MQEEGTTASLISDLSLVGSTRVCGRELDHKKTSHKPRCAAFPTLFLGLLQVQLRERGQRPPEVTPKYACIFPPHRILARSELALVGALSLRHAPLQHGMTALTTLDLSSCSSLTSLTVEFHNPLVGIYGPRLPLTSTLCCLKCNTRLRPLPWVPWVIGSDPIRYSEAVQLPPPSPRSSTMNMQPKFDVSCVQLQHAPFSLSPSCFPLI